MVGQSIKTIRRHKKLTQEKLAHKLGVSRQAICMWESGKRELKMSTLNKIAKMLSVSMSEIIQLHHSCSTQNRNKEGGGEMKKRQKRINFELKAPGARKVTLAGDFNSWKETEMSTKRKNSGLWRVGVNLQPGRYEYKFIVDGQWINDPANANIVNNSLGTLNSVKEVACK